MRVKFDAEALGRRNMAPSALRRDRVFGEEPKRKTVQRDRRAALFVHGPVLPKAGTGRYFTSTNSTGVPTSAILTMRYGAAVVTYIVTGAAPPDMSTR